MDVLVGMKVMSMKIGVSDGLNDDVECPRAECVLASSLAVMKVLMNGVGVDNCNLALDLAMSINLGKMVAKAVKVMAMSNHLGHGGAKLVLKITMDAIAFVGGLKIALLLVPVLLDSKPVGNRYSNSR